MNQRFFHDKYEAHMNVFMGRDFKISVINTFAANLCVLKSAYLLRKHPVASNLISIYFKSFQLYDHQKGCINKISQKLI